MRKKCRIGRGKEGGAGTGGRVGAGRGGGVTAGIDSGMSRNFPPLPNVGLISCELDCCLDGRIIRAIS